MNRYIKYIGIGLGIGALLILGIYNYEYGLGLILGLIGLYVAYWILGGLFMLSWNFSLYKEYDGFKPYIVYTGITSGLSLGALLFGFCSVPAIGIIVSVIMFFNLVMIITGLFPNRRKIINVNEYIHGDPPWYGFEKAPIKYKFDPDTGFTPMTEELNSNSSPAEVVPKEVVNTSDLDSNSGQIFIDEKNIITPQILSALLKNEWNGGLFSGYKPSEEDMKILKEDLDSSCVITHMNDGFSSDIDSNNTKVFTPKPPAANGYNNIEL